MTLLAIKIPFNLVSLYYLVMEPLLQLVEEMDCPNHQVEIDFMTG